MNNTDNIDWKFAVALSAPVAVGVLLWKLTPEQAAAVSQKAIDAAKEIVIALKGNH